MDSINENSGFMLLTVASDEECSQYKGKAGDIALSVYALEFLFLRFSTSKCVRFSYVHSTITHLVDAFVQNGLHCN